MMIMNDNDNDKAHRDSLYTRPKGIPHKKYLHVA